MSDTRQRIDHHLRNLTAAQKDVLAAVKSSTHTHLAAEAMREVRDTQRHNELMASQQAVAGALDRLSDTLVAEIRQVALILLEQTTQLKRIADTLETPRATQARELRGMASKHVRAGNLPAARQLLTESLDLDATEHAAYLMLGYLLYTANEPDAAVETLLTSVNYASGSIEVSRGQSRPARAYTLHMAARVRASQQRYQEAADLLTRAMDSCGIELTHWHELASYLAAAGEFEQALGALAYTPDKDLVRASKERIFSPIAPAVRELLQTREAKQRERLKQTEAELEQEVRRAGPLVKKLSRMRRRYARRSQPLDEEQCLLRLEQALATLRTRLRDPDVLLSEDVASEAWRAVKASREAPYQARIDELRALLRARGRKRLIYGAIATAVVLSILAEFSSWREEAARERFEAGLDQRWYVAPMTGYEMGAELAGLLFEQDRDNELTPRERQAAQFAQAAALLGPFQRNTMPDWMSWDILTGYYGELVRLTDADDDHHLKEHLENLRLAHFGARHQARGVVRKAREDTTRAMFDERRTLILMRHMWADYATQDDTPPAERAAYQPLVERAAELIESFVRDESIPSPP